MFLPLSDNVERREIPIVTVLLIVANALVYCHQSNVFYSENGGYEAEYEFLLSWALVPDAFFSGDLHGLLSHMFLHGDILHLLGNMLILWAFSCTLEEAWGPGTLFGFYILFGIVAGLAHALTNWGSEIPMVGASGAIAGLMGAYGLMFGAKSKIRTFVFIMFRGFVVEIPAGVYCFGWFIMQVWSSYESGEGSGGVAWWAHIGGFLAGAAVVGICRNEFDQVLTHGDDGELKFERLNQSEEPEESEVPEHVGPLPIPAQCPYCCTEMNENNRMADNLARCKNPDCERMIMLEPELELARS